MPAMGASWFFGGAPDLAPSHGGLRRSHYGSSSRLVRRAVFLWSRAGRADSRQQVDDQLAPTLGPARGERLKHRPPGAHESEMAGDVRLRPIRVDGRFDGDISGALDADVNEVPPAWVRRDDGDPTAAKAIATSSTHRLAGGPLGGGPGGVSACAR